VLKFYIYRKSKYNFVKVVG